MDLRQTLIDGHSKEHCNRIIEWIGSDQKRFDLLVHLFLTDEYRIVQRAAWPLSYAVQAFPQLADKHLGEFVSCLTDLEKPPAVKRNILRLLPSVSIPEALQGRVIDTCFNFILDPKEAAAVKAFSLTILDQLAAEYPELKRELLLIIEERFSRESPAFRSRAKKIMQHKASKTSSQKD